MLEDVNNNININSGLLGQLNNNNVSRVNSIGGSAYGTVNDTSQLIDQGEISDEAIRRYEAEAEISKYKSIVLDMLRQETASEEVTSLADLISNNQYEINDTTLADAIFNDEDAQNLLF